MTTTNDLNKSIKNSTPKTEEQNQTQKNALKVKINTPKTKHQRVGMNALYLSRCRMKCRVFDGQNICETNFLCVYIYVLTTRLPTYVLFSIMYVYKSGARTHQRYPKRLSFPLPQSSILRDTKSSSIKVRINKNKNNNKRRKRSVYSKKKFIQRKQKRPHNYRPKKTERKNSVGVFCFTILYTSTANQINNNNPNITFCYVSLYPS